MILCSLVRRSFGLTCRFSLHGKGDILKVEAALIFEASVKIYQITRYHIPEDRNLHGELRSVASSHHHSQRFHSRPYQNMLTAKSVHDNNCLPWHSVNSRLYRARRTALISDENCGLELDILRTKSNGISPSQS